MIQDVGSSIEVIHSDVVQAKNDDNEDADDDPSFLTRSSGNEDADNNLKFLLSGDGNNVDITSVDPGNDPNENLTIDPSNKPCINPVINVGDPNSDPGYNQRDNHSFTMGCNQLYVSLGETLIVPILNYLALWGNTPLDVSTLDFDLLYEWEKISSTVPIPTSIFQMGKYSISTPW